MRTVWIVVVGVLWVAQAVWFQQAGAGLGFPDGHLTELGRSRKVLYPTVALACLVAGAATLAVGRRWPKAALAAFPLGTAGIRAIDLGLAAMLDDGAGG